MYHTQEKRADSVLSEPILCKGSDAWLGIAYYFWYSEGHAIMWGNVRKKATGYYQIYSADVDTSRIIDTVFNEEHYSFWVAKIELAANVIFKNIGRKPTLEQINKYFVDNGVYTGIDGVLFQDISNSQHDTLVEKFQYRKRIQLAAFSLNIIDNFAPHLDGQCEIKPK